MFLRKPLATCVLPMGGSCSRSASASASSSWISGIFLLMLYIPVQPSFYYIGTKLCSTVGSVSYYRYSSEDPRMGSSIPALSHNFVAIDSEKISMAIILH